MLTLINTTKHFIKFKQYFNLIPISYNKYIIKEFHLLKQQSNLHLNNLMMNNKYYKHFYQNTTIKMHTNIYKKNNFLTIYNKHKEKVLFIIIVICFSYLIWYFLYYKNKLIIHEFLDFEIKRTLSKLLTNNPSVITFLSNEIHSILTHPQFQEQIKLFILHKYLQNDKMKLNIQYQLKEYIINYLSSNNAVLLFSNIIISFFNSEYGKNIINKSLYEYMEHTGKEYLKDLIEMKIIQLINDNEFRKYVFSEVHNEMQKYLNQKDNVKSLLECLKKEYKI